MVRYFAKINENNIVEQVIVADTKSWVNDKLDGVWVETFKNGKTKNYAAIGHTYDFDAKNFHAPQPFPSWILNSNFDWEAPKPKPTISDEEFARWNEEILDWEIFDSNNNLIIK